MRIIFVGIHNKPDTTPLDSKTKSGKLIDKIIFNLKNHDCLKTNLFNTESIPQENIEQHQQTWIKTHNPKEKDIIILLGNNAQKLFPQNISSKIIKVKHPSAIWSKQSQENYIKNIIQDINNFIN